MAPAWTDKEGSDVIRHKNAFALETLAELKYHHVYVTFLTEWRSFLSCTNIVLSMRLLRAKDAFLIV